VFRSAELQGYNPIEKLLEMAKLAIGKKDHAADFFKQATWIFKELK